MPNTSTRHNRPAVWKRLETKAVECPTCGAAVGERCHSTSGRPSNQPHAPRYYAALAQPNPRYREPRTRSIKPKGPWWEARFVEEEDIAPTVRIEFDSLDVPNMDAMRIGARRVFRNHGLTGSVRLGERVENDYATGRPCAFYFVLEEADRASAA